MPRKHLSSAQKKLRKQFILTGNEARFRPTKLGFFYKPRTWDDIDAWFGRTRQTREAVMIAEDEGIIRHIVDEGKWVKQLDSAFWQAYKQMCARLGVNPVHLAMVIFSESGWNATAYNASGPAGGLIQMMMVSLKGTGFNGDPLAYSRIPAIEQLPYMERYYGPHAKYMTTPACCYVINFLPAYIVGVVNSIAIGEDYIFGEKLGAGYSGLIYKYNPGLDVNKDGRITYNDLVARLNQVASGQKWNSILQALGDTETRFARKMDWRATYAIKQVQRAINVVMKDTGHSVSVDGILGPMTTNMVKEFQGSCNLTQDAMPGPATRKALALALKAASVKT